MTHNCEHLSSFKMNSPSENENQRLASPFQSLLKNRAELYYASRHGRRSSKWFGGAPNFFPKNDLRNFARKINWSPEFFCLNKILSLRLVDFSVQIRVISKKKKFIVSIWSSFLSSMLISKKSVEQNCPKNMKLPKILTRDRHLKIKRGNQCPPGFPTSYATIPAGFLKAAVTYKGNFSQCF